LLKNQNLYTYLLEIYWVGTYIFLSNSYEITDAGILVIYYEIVNAFVAINDEDIYVMIFEIDKFLYHSVDNVEVRDFYHLNEKLNYYIQAHIWITMISINQLLGSHHIMII